MAGSVLVFNTTNASLQLILNNTVVSSPLAAVTQSGGYAPTTIAIVRNPSTGNPGTNQFGGQNTLIVSYGSGGGTSQTFPIDISSTANPIANDLQLYLFFNEAVLVSQGGQGSNVGGGAQVTQVIKGAPVSPEAVQALMESSQK